METFVVRPGAVLAKGSWIPGLLVGWSLSIQVDELAAVMVASAVEGKGGVGGKRQIWYSGELRAEGKRLLEGRTGGGSEVKE